jgi:hypothetical protein
VNRLLVHLMRARNGDTVMLEVIGDTGVRGADGSYLSEELKSRTSDRNPVADDAVDLWRTLHNWIDAVQAAELPPDRTHFRLHVTRPFHGALVQRLAAVTTSADASAAIAAARAQLLAPAPTDLPVERHIGPGRDGEEIPTSVAGGVADAASAGAVAAESELLQHVRAVCDAPAEVTAAVLIGFAVEFGSGDAAADTSAALEPVGLDPSVQAVLRDDLLGWVKTYVDVQIQRGLPAAVPVNDFRRHLGAKLRQLCNQLVLASVAPEPSDRAVDAHRRTLRSYVRQLQFIDAEEDDVLQAVTDYLWAGAERVQWGELGWVLPSSFKPFENELRLAWKRKQAQVAIAHRAATAAERGQLLYGSCCEHTAKLDGRETPPHFCRGSLHALADEGAIGWHPEFPRLLSSSDDGREVA